MRSIWTILLITDRIKILTFINKEIMSKVTVVGAGNVGATCANVLVTTGVADEVVLIDIKEGLF